MNLCHGHRYSRVARGWGCQHGVANRRARLQAPQAVPPPSLAMLARTLDRPSLCRNQWPWWTSSGMGRREVWWRAGLLCSGSRSWAAADRWSSLSQWVEQDRVASSSSSGLANLGRESRSYSYPLVAGKSRPSEQSTKSIVAGRGGPARCPAA